MSTTALIALEWLEADDISETLNTDFVSVTEAFGSSEIDFFTLDSLPIPVFSEETPGSIDDFLMMWEPLIPTSGSDLLVEFSAPQLEITLGGWATTSWASTSWGYYDPVEFGTPFVDAWYWRQQQGPASCAVVAQISVYESLTGVYISEDIAGNFAQNQGWFDPLTGTPLMYVGHILDSLGIPTIEFFGASLADLQYALAMGDKPIVGLDANEIWNPIYDYFGNPLEQENGGHAVWVTGINYGWDGSVSIILNDSGTPNGMASEIAYADFMNAWQDYGNFVSIADNPFV
ncbi:MAG: hypothetical protein ACHWZW_14095 [Spirulina sp.]